VKAQLFLGGLLFVSVSVNISLWRRLSTRASQLETVRTSVHDFRQQDPDSPIAPASPRRDTDSLELARLRNEVAQLRRDSKEAAAEAAELRTQVAEGAQNLARAESELADSVKRSPEEWQRMIQAGQSDKCANHLKQICVAAWIWADDHNQVFPPDFVSMRQELDGPEGPQVLFCPADTTSPRITQWQQLNAASITYRFLNPNGRHDYSTNLLVTCPRHGHFVLSDGSVHRR
jgi:hypothetical protein